VHESKLGRMKYLSRRSAGIVFGRLTESMGIELLAAQAMADFGQVNANLVRATSFQSAFDNGVIAEVLHRPHVCDSLLGALGSLALWRAAAEAIAAVANEPGVDGLRLIDPAMYDGHVRSLDLVSGEHADELLLGLGRARENHQAAGIPVEAVDRANLKPSVNAAISGRGFRPLLRPSLTLRVNVVGKPKAQMTGQDALDEFIECWLKLLAALGQIGFFAMAEGR
jgi:hypothetical protein